MGLSLGTASDGNKEETVSTPQIRRLNVDPRSPSTGIPRTPIEVVRTPVAQALSPRVQELLDTSLDPRSPTNEFYRTPIVFNEEFRNKHLDKAKRTGVFTPKLLETNTKIVKHVEHKRNSFVGLLETNIDFVETDLDTVTQTSEEVIANDLETKLSIIDDDAVNKCVEELDKKLTNLINEDVDEFDIKTTLTKKTRTPLGDRHINQRHQKKVAMPVLKVSDKPRNLSKIPVFKDKGRHMQCENTPPTMLAKRSHWSTEDSLII